MYGRKNSSNMAGRYRAHSPANPSSTSSPAARPPARPPRFREVRNEPVAPGARHPGVRVRKQEALFLHELEMGLLVITDDGHDSVQERRVVVHPREEVVVADQLEQVHGEAGVEVAQPGPVAGVGIEGVPAAQPHRKDVAEDVFQQLLLVEALPPVDAAGALVQLAARPSPTARRS